MFKKFQALISGGKKVYDTISSVAPKVNKTKLDKAKSALAIATQKTKASTAKLGQTMFESKNKAFKGDDFTFSYSKKKTPKVSEQKAKGGRVGLKFGSKRKSNVQKIKETFGPGSSNPKKSAAKKKKFPDLTGDGKVTFADILKGRGVKRG